MSESKTYPPSRDFVAQAHVKGLAAYQDLYNRAKDDPEAFWGDLAVNRLDWFAPFSKTLEWNPPLAKWFAGGKINASLQLRRPSSENRSPDQARASSLKASRAINASSLTRNCTGWSAASPRSSRTSGYKTGDRAIIYMPMIPELPIALLACARLGITHSVVFGGFSAEALKARIQDLDATLVITADGGWRRGKEVRLKGAVDEALLSAPMSAT